MPRRAAVVLLRLCAGLVLLAGCRADPPAEPPPPPAPRPALGGPTPRWHAPPPRAMDETERTLAHRLAAQVAAEGMTLAYLDCPAWRGDVPGRMTCRGYLDGLVADVRVVLTAAQDDTVDFDARLSSALVATARLETTLRERGWSDVDCGEARAYPARVGSRIVCRTRRGGVESYVVATVTSATGAVRIAGYGGSGRTG